MIKEQPKKTYYILPLDSYGQPSGHIEEIELTKVEYIKLKQELVYVYDNYTQAMYRAMD